MSGTETKGQRNTGAHLRLPQGVDALQTTPPIKPTRTQIREAVGIVGDALLRQANGEVNPIIWNEDIRVFNDDYPRTKIMRQKYLAITDVCRKLSVRCDTPYEESDFTDNESGRTEYRRRLVVSVSTRIPNS